MNVGRELKTMNSRKCITAMHHAIIIELSYNDHAHEKEYNPDIIRRND